MGRKVNQPRQNKALHPTAYSFGFPLRSFLAPRRLRFRRRVSLVVVLLRLPNRSVAVVLRSLILGRVESEYSRRRFCSSWFPVLTRRFRLLVARRFCSRAGLGCRRLIRFGSGRSTCRARQAAGETSQQQHNKALHPTAYSFAPSFVPHFVATLPAAGELGRSVACARLGCVR